MVELLFCLYLVPGILLVGLFLYMNQIWPKYGPPGTFAQKFENVIWCVCIAIVCLLFWPGVLYYFRKDFKSMFDN